MSETIKQNKIVYPAGTMIHQTKQTPLHTKNTKKAKLGEDFETRINHSNEYYRNKKIACIYKKPTPIQVVSVDYPNRSKARITEAYYRTPSTTDYNGIYNHKYIDFEAKSCHSTSFAFTHIYAHQIEHLRFIQSLGGIAFLLLEFVPIQKIFVIPASSLVELYDQSKKGGRKSIPFDYCEENCLVVETTYNAPVDYIKTVDKIFFQERKEES